MLKMLAGGDRRSIGRSNEVVALVLKQPHLFDILIPGMSLDDALVRMRCADAAEKITALHPEYLRSHKRTLIEDLSRIEQKEVRWHVAAMLARLPLGAKEQERVIGILLAYTNDRSSIVKTVAMQALADLAARDQKLRPLVRRHIEELSAIGTPAMRARGKHLLPELESAPAKTERKAPINPVNQFIEIAPDCALKAAVVPKCNRKKQTIAAIEHELLSSKPYGHTLEQLKFAVHARHKRIPAAELKARRRQLWDDFFAKPYACMRASPLTRQYGWGAHYDQNGKIAIYAVESKEYRRFVNDKNVKKYFAMRGKRA